MKLAKIHLNPCQNSDLTYSSENPYFGEMSPYYMNSGKRHTSTLLKLKGKTERRLLTGSQAVRSSSNSVELTGVSLPYSWLCVSPCFTVQPSCGDQVVLVGPSCILKEGPFTAELHFSLFPNNAVLLSFVSAKLFETEGWKSLHMLILDIRHMRKKNSFDLKCNFKSSTIIKLLHWLLSSFRISQGALFWTGSFLV